MYIMGIDVTKVRPATVQGVAGTGPEFNLGTLGMTSNGKIYKYIQYNVGGNVVAAVAGNVVGYLAPAGSFAAQGYANNKVTSDVANALVAAGVLQAVIADQGFGWVQIRGLALLTPALVSGADGQTLVLSTTTNGTLKVAAAVTDVAGAIAQSAAGKTIICNFPF